MASGGTPAQPRPVLRVAVASDQALVAESVAAALRARGFDPVVVQWPRHGPEPWPRARGRRVPRRSVGPPPDVGLAATDLVRVEQVHGVAALVTGLAVPWLVLSGIPRGPAWGGLYERGVALVVPQDTGLDEAAALLSDLAAGRTPIAKRRDLIQAWRDFAERRDELAARLQTLTDREGEVLQHLYEGMPVRMIAEQWQVGEATVRGQVKQILRKLNVRTQLAAVAAYQDVLMDSTKVELS